MVVMPAVQSQGGGGANAPRAGRSERTGTKRARSGDQTATAQSRRPSIGPVLLRLRLEAGLTQRGLADLTRQVCGRGVDKFTISGHESGDNDAPRAATTARLAAALSHALKRPITANDLMGGQADSLAEYLAAERERRGLTVTAYSAHLGIEPERYVQLERQEIPWSPADLGRIMAAEPTAIPLVQAALLADQPSAAEAAGPAAA